MSEFLYNQPSDRESLSMTPKSRAILPPLLPLLLLMINSVTQESKASTQQKIS